MSIGIADVCGTYFCTEGEYWIRHHILRISCRIAIMYIVILSLSLEIWHKYFKTILLPLSPGSEFSALQNLRLHFSFLLLWFRGKILFAIFCVPSSLSCKRKTESHWTNFRILGEYMCAIVVGIILSLCSKYYREQLTKQRAARFYDWQEWQIVDVNPCFSCTCAWVSRNAIETAIRGGYNNEKYFPFVYDKNLYTLCCALHVERVVVSLSLSSNSLYLCAPTYVLNMRFVQLKNSKFK